MTFPFLDFYGLCYGSLKKSPSASKRHSSLIERFALHVYWSVPGLCKEQRPRGRSRGSVPGLSLGVRRGGLCLSRDPSESRSTSPSLGDVRPSQHVVLREMVLHVCIRSPIG